MPSEIKPVGILAGEGALPIQLVNHCLNNKIPICVVQFAGCDYVEYPEIEILQTRLEKVGEIFKFLKSNNVENVVMIGNLQRPSLNSFRPDWRGLKTLGRIAGAFAKGDDNLLRSLRKEIESEGFSVVGIDHYLKNLTAQAGTLTKTQSSLDLSNAIAVSLHHGVHDKGQSILAHNDGTYSYEGRDGTTALICTCGRVGSILVKTVKPNQDPDLDRPTVGIHTLEALREKQCLGMAVQADGVLMVDMDAMIAYANEHHLFIEVVNV